MVLCVTPALHSLPRWLALALAIVCAVHLAHAAENDRSADASNRLRVIIETDAGGDPDDEQSLVRFLLYANEWDVEGIIANRTQARDGENLNVERTGLGIVRAMIGAYGQSWPNLRVHDPRYPHPDQLLQRTVAGYDEVDDGMRLILTAVDRDDPRPIWYADWGTDVGGGRNNLRRALDHVLAQRGAEAYARFKAKLRLASADAFGEHTREIAPPFALYVDTFKPPYNGKRWYHTFSALTATAGGFDVQRDLRTHHGPLGALYPLNTTHRQKEGDSMTFLYLVPTGMNDPEQPTWGSWAGRYGPQPDAGQRKYFWANQQDSFQGTTSRENSLARWAAAMQNDFAARADWCVAGKFSATNHPPAVVLNADRSQGILQLAATSGQRIALSAAGSNDPDGQPLNYSWFVYPEAGTFNGPCPLSDSKGESTSFLAPTVDRPQTVHVLLAASDQGQPALTRYRRAVVTIAPSLDHATTPPIAWRETKSFPAEEAGQAAAADNACFYAITNRAIGKYDRRTGERVAVSTGSATHLNSGFFWQGQLYCAHSNYPQKPERSEIMVLDPATMQLNVHHRFANQSGSLTWAVRHQDAWWCCFAFYDDENHKTYLARLDDAWREQARWTLPKSLVAMLGRHSLSGGIWHDGQLLATDHDNYRIYRLNVPPQVNVLELVDVQTAPFAGQGFAHDPVSGGLIGIDRKKRVVVIAESQQ